MPFADTTQPDTCRYRPVPVAYYTSHWWLWQELFISDRDCGLKSGDTTLFRLSPHLMCVNPTTGTTSKWHTYDTLRQNDVTKHKIFVREYSFI